MTISKTRAIAVFGKNDFGGVAWPYGVAAQDTRPPEWTTEQYEAHLKDREQAQQLVFDWAQKYGLKKGKNRCCPKWLTRDRNSTCAGTKDPCALYDASSPDRAWLDHVTTWTFDKLPAVITAAPYSIDQDDRDRLAWWTTEDPRLGVAYGGPGWYGHSTKQIVLWRTDLIEIVGPA
ncbi:hypothetical protein [Streptomyces sp. NPDC087538]|uniref:hypothetical protein n=1 Tax=Streptomyces sp. NPDC087538 TaxID=3365797 RepID=UPI0038093DA2